MYYLGMGLLFLWIGSSLLFGTKGYLPPASKIPINFNPYKDEFGIFFIFAGYFMFYLAYRSGRAK